MKSVIKIAWTFLLLPLCIAQSEFDFLEGDELYSKTSEIAEDDFEGLNKINEMKVPSLPRVENQVPAVTKEPEMHYQVAEMLGGKPLPQPDNGRMLILRTFCPFDIDKLADGLDIWTEYFPCADTDEQLMNTDILLFFSASWDLWPKALETSEEIVRKFDEGYYPWARCFGKIMIDSANMDPEQDLYDPPKQRTNRLWVNGPNRQFEKGLRTAQFPRDQHYGYQLAYLMEPDSVPLQRFWLDRLRKEVEERRPFAVLGSKYRGDNWYDFIRDLEIPLLNHFNGNAVYNISNPLMNLMLGQLETEADEMYNFIPFDLRMSQMWAEGTMGVVSNMLPSGELDNLVEGVITPRNNTALFQSWWEEHGYHNDVAVMQESMVIKNYAATNMLPKFLGPETIIHGAAMFKRWGADRPMALVVSDWDEGFLEGFIDSLNHDQHPFVEVIIMRPVGSGKISHGQLVDMAKHGITIRSVEREHEDFMDWCEAPVESEWFMYVNTYFKVRKYVDILLTEEDKPLMSYIYADLPFCLNYESCKFAVERARSFDPDADKHVQDFELVINTDERDQFCSVWKGLNMPPPGDPCVPQGPTATSFLAYLNSKRKAKKLYKMKDKAQFGWRSVFKHAHESIYVDKCSEGRRLAATNVTVCRDIEDPVECEEEPKCEYDYQFLTCFESEDGSPTLSPTISAPPTVTPSPTVVGQTSLPTPAPTKDTNPYPTPSPTSAEPGLTCTEPSHANYSCTEPLGISFTVDGGAETMCESFTIEVFSAATHSVIDSFSISSIFYNQTSSRRRLGDAASIVTSSQQHVQQPSYSSTSPLQVGEKAQMKLRNKRVVMSKDNGESEPVLRRNNAHNSIGEGVERMIIVRPFSPWDMDKLESSFDEWEMYMPCSASSPQSTEIDILLFYSANFEAWPMAREVAEKIVWKFFAGHYSWAKCFNNMYLGSAALSQLEDRYEPMMQNRDLLWVNGPNRQFEAAAEAVQNPPFTKKPYELFYLMEPDSMPWQNGWMDKLILDLEARRPFAVVGSKYHGYKWHDFETRLPLPLLHHLNGNAVYNVSHELTKNMLGQLKSEADSLWNMIPFDLRMGQMWMEGTLGLAEDMLPDTWNGTTLEDGDAWADNTAKFQEWWRKHGYHKGKPAMQETSVIRNYAATNMLKQYLLGTETITHGANMYNRWDIHKNGHMALVISDWGDAKELTRMLNSLANSNHPFREVIVLTTESAESEDSELDVDWDKLFEMGVSITLVNREMSSDSMDWCMAPMESEWFMYTNSYHRLRSTIDIMVTDDGRPLIPFVHADSTHCSDFPACVASMDRARIFDPDFDKHVQDFDMVFNLKLRDEFCESWISLDLADPGDPCVPQGPTASSYLAFIATTRRMKQTYKINDKSMYGYRNIFLRASVPYSACESGRRLTTGNETLANETACMYYDTESTCDAMSPTCAWDPLYLMCYPVEDATPVMAPSAAPTMLPTASDTSSVEVDFTITAITQPSTFEQGALKQSIATLSGILEEHLLSFTVTPNARRLETLDELEKEGEEGEEYIEDEPKTVEEVASYQHTHRKLLSSTSYTVAFTVTVSLAELGETSVDELITLLEDVIEGNDFANAVTTDINGASYNGGSLSLLDVTHHAPGPVTTLVSIAWNHTIMSYHASLVISADQVYTPAIEDSIKQALLGEAAFSGAALSEFLQITNTYRRKLLSTVYEWNIYFDIVTQLSATHFCSTHDMFIGLEDTLGSVQFEASLINSIGTSLSVTGSSLELAETELYVRTSCGDLQMNCSSPHFNIGTCDVSEDSHCVPSFSPSLTPTTFTPVPSRQPSIAPVPTSSPTNDTWTIGTWIPTPVPTLAPSGSPTITSPPTISYPPTDSPTLSLMPSLAPTLQPTTEIFTCANVWDDLTDISMPWSFTDTQTKWAPVFVPRDLRFINDHPKWLEDEMWTMEMTVSSTCANDLVISWCSKRGFMKITIPAFAEDFTITVVDTIKFAPSYIYMRNKCKTESVLTISDVKLGYGSCNSDVGPTLLPVPAPTSLPTSSPTNDTWTIGTWIPTPVPTLAPSGSPTVTSPPTISYPPTDSPTLSLMPSLAPTLHPTTETFTCANIWNDFTDISLPWSFTDTRTKWAPVFVPRDLRFINAHPMWEEGEMWTMEMTVSSTCANDLVISWCSKRGFMKLTIPAFAEDFTITAVDVVKFAPSYIYMRNKCRTDSVLTISEVKLGYGSCNSDVGPTLLPTVPPTALPSKFPSFSASPIIAPTASPSIDYSGLLRVPTALPTLMPTSYPGATPVPSFSKQPTLYPTLSLLPTVSPSLTPTTESFSCADLFGSLVDATLPVSFTNTESQWAEVFSAQQLSALENHAHWEVAEIWTLQMKVTSTCPDDLTFSFSGKGGALKITVPAFAEDEVVTVVDAIKMTPNIFFMRNKCSTASEVTFESIKIGHGSCNQENSPTLLPTTYHPTVQPHMPSALPTSSPTNDTWTVGTWIPTPVPTLAPSGSPTVTSPPTISYPPTDSPTLSLMPSLAPTLQPTTETFTCANVWDDLTDISMPWSFTDTQTKWAPVFVPRDLRFLNEHPRWVEGEMWTMEMTVTSTCANDLVISWCSKRGFMKMTIPALAEDFTITVVDTIKFAPSYIYMRNKCRTESELTISDVKIGYGSCNSNVGPTALPTFMPTFLSVAPTASPPSIMPSPMPTDDTWTSGSWIPSPMPSLEPVGMPTRTLSPTATPRPSAEPTKSMMPSSVPTLQPTTESFTCANVWDDLTEMSMPWSFTNTETKWAPVFVPRDLRFLNQHPKWQAGEMWTMEITVSSTCPNDLTLSFSSATGDLLVIVPAFAEDVTLTVVDTLTNAPSYYYMRNKCQSASELTVSEVKLGYGSCNSAVGPTAHPTFMPTITSLSPTAAPGDPTISPTALPTTDEWTMGTWIPTAVPTPVPSASPSLSMQPTISFSPTLVPSYSLMPSLAPTLQPTTETFTCANVWDDRVDVSMPWSFTNTQTKWAPVFIPRDLRFINAHPKWEEGEMWTMEMTVTSTCPNDLVFSWCSTRGFMKIIIPAFAEDYTVTVVDTVKFAPSYIYMRNKCSSASVVTISEVKLGHGSCNSDVGPTLLPTVTPLITADPTSLPTTQKPTSFPTASPTAYLPSSKPTNTYIPTSSPTEYPSPRPTISAHPTRKPTLLPTSLPSNHPTIVATPEPTTSCPTDVPLLHPVMRVHTGVAYGKSALTMAKDNVTASRQFGLLSGGASPGDGFSFGVYLDNDFVGSAGGGGTTLPEKADGISVLLKTPNIYHDSRMIRVAYQLIDASGRSHVSTDGLELEMELIHNDTSMQVTCDSLPNITSGLGVCSVEVPLWWFSTEFSSEVHATMSAVYNSVAVVTSRSLLATTVQMPNFFSLDGANMEAVLPHHPLSAGEVFEVNIDADTNNNALRTWQFELSYDSSVVEYLSVETSDTFTSAIVIAENGIVSVSTVGLAYGASIHSAANTGSEVHVATLKFKVQESVTSGTKKAFWLQTLSMTNEDSITLVHNKTGQLNDMRGDGHVAGQLSIETANPVGIFSYAAVNEIVNTAPLTGVSVTAPITTLLVYDGVVASKDISNEATCALNNDDISEVMTIENCNAIVSYTHHASALLPVAVSFDDYATLVSFIIWYPETVYLTSSDTELNEVDLSSGPNVVFADDNDSSGCVRYQMARLSAYAKFTCGDDEETIDITDFVEFKSSDENVLAIVDSEVEGKSLGSATVSVFTHTASTYVSANMLTFTVSSTQVMVEALTVAVYTNASWNGGSGAVDMFSTVEPSLTFSRSLRAVGDIGHVQIYAEFNDGTWEDVTRESTIGLLSNMDNVLEMIDHNSFALVEDVPTDWCLPALAASWSPCNNTGSFTGFGFVEKDLPEPVGCNLHISETQIAAAGDGATLQPFNITDSAFLTAYVHYDDGSYVDFSEDTRAVFTIIGGDDLAELDGNILTVKSNAIIEAHLNRHVTIEVSFPGLYDTTCTVTIEVIEFEYLTLSATNYPSDVSIGSISTLRAIDCTGLYQRAEMRAVGYLTDGTWKGGVSFSRWVDFTSSDALLGEFTSEPCFRGLCRTLATKGPGSLTVEGVFGGKNAYLPLEILGDAVNITSVEILETIGAFDTLHGIVGTTDNMEVLVGFSDGTSFVVSDSGHESSEWLRPSALLDFTSEYPHVVSVDTEGVVTLHGNYYTSNQLTAVEKCANVYSDTLDIYANLDPEEHDVDLGHLYGPSLRQQTVGDNFVVDVRIQASGDEPLTAFQVKVTFDYDEVRVDSDDFCGNQAAWGWNFECTSNDPEYELLMVGSCGLANVADCATFNNVPVGYITFRAVKEGFIHLTGEVIKNMGNVTETDDKDIFAGDAWFYIVGTDDDNDDGARRKLEASSKMLEHETKSVALKSELESKSLAIDGERRRLTDCETMQGDINGDCVCDVADVRMLQYYIGGELNMTGMTDLQIYSLDANYDGVINGADVTFLLRVVAYKYRFLTDYSTTPNPFTLSISMLTWESLPSHRNQSNLWMELALDANKEMNMTFDYGNVTDSPDGIFIYPENMGVGVYGAGGPPMVTELDVPLVVIVETYDVFGDSNKARLCPFYCTRRIEMCRNAFGDSAEAFIAYKYPDLIVPVPTPNPTLAPTTTPWDGTNLNAARSASANAAAIMGMASAMIVAMIIRHYYSKGSSAAKEPFQQYNMEEAINPEAEGYVAGVFKKWKPPPAPPQRMKSVEFVQDLQEPGVLEKGKGADEGRRLTGELMPGLLEVHPQLDEAQIPDFLALKDPNLVLGAGKFQGREPPVLRIDQSEPWGSDDEGAPPPPGAYQPPPQPPRDHSANITQLPAKSPGGPRLRVEKPKFSDDEDSDEEWNPSDPNNMPAAPFVSQMPPKYDGAPQVRLERNSKPDDDFSDDSDSDASDVSDLSGEEDEG